MARTKSTASKAAAKQKAKPLPIAKPKRTKKRLRWNNDFYRARGLYTEQHTNRLERREHERGVKAKRSKQEAKEAKAKHKKQLQTEQLQRQNERDRRQQQRVNKKPDMLLPPELFERYASQLEAWEGDGHYFDDFFRPATEGGGGCICSKKQWLRAERRFYKTGSYAYNQRGGAKRIYGCSNYKAEAALPKPGPARKLTGKEEGLLWKEGQKEKKKTTQKDLAEHNCTGKVVSQTTISRTFRQRAKEKGRKPLSTQRITKGLCGRNLPRMIDAGVSWSQCVRRMLDYKPSLS